MTTKRRSLPTKRAYIPQPEPEDTLIQRARRLPLSGPGIVVTVPLSLLPAYLELHGLQPSGRLEPNVQPKYGPGEAILLVKRVRIKKAETK